LCRVCPPVALEIVFDLQVSQHSVARGMIELTLGSVPLVLHIAASAYKWNKHALTPAYLTVRTILFPVLLFSPLNVIMLPEDSGNTGLKLGGFELSCPVVRSRTAITDRPAMALG
jgi:hypothetical protein